MEWVAAISILSAVSAILLGWLGFMRKIQNSIKDSIRDEASAGAEIKTDMDYIKRGVDEMRLEQKDQGRRFDTLSERVTRVEESAKQAHHRLNRIEGN